MVLPAGLEPAYTYLEDTWLIQLANGSKNNYAFGNRL